MFIFNFFHNAKKKIKKKNKLRWLQNMYKTAKKSEQQSEQNETPFISQPNDLEENPLKSKKFLEMTEVNE